MSQPLRNMADEIPQATKFSCHEIGQLLTFKYKSFDAGFDKLKRPERQQNHFAASQDSCLSFNSLVICKMKLM